MTACTVETLQAAIKAKTVEIDEVGIESELRGLDGRYFPDVLEDLTEALLICTRKGLLKLDSSTKPWKQLHVGVKLGVLAVEKLGINPREAKRLILESRREALTPEKALDRLSFQFTRDVVGHLEEDWWEPITGSRNFKRDNVVLGTCGLWLSMISGQENDALAHEMADSLKGISDFSDLGWDKT